MSDMEKHWKTEMLRSMKVLHAVLMTAAFMCWWYFSFAARKDGAMLVAQGSLILCLHLLLNVMLCRIYHAYDVGMVRVWELFYSQSLANLISAGMMYAVLSVSMMHLINPLPLVGALGTQTLLSAVWSVLCNKLYFALHAPDKTAIVYQNPEDLRKIRQINYFEDKFDVQRYIQNPPDDIDAVLNQIEGCSVVFVVGVSATLRNGIAEYCVEHGVVAYIAPHVGDILLSGARPMQMFSVPVLRVQRAAPRLEYLLVKRVFDAVTALMAIIVTSPVMLLTALAVKIYDGGPVFYRQTRLTQNRREFRIIKFRSMRVDAEKDGVARLASDHDDRITPVGKVIRACRVDELPQLFNILKGDMTFVGPRPERPEIAADYERAIPSFALRLQVKAGLTGYAQVYGRYNTAPYDKLQMDLMYINNMSIAQDLKLLFATVKILFMKESTSGVQQGRTTAMEIKEKA